MALRYRSVFTKTESPASLDRIAKGLRPPAVKLYLARSRSARPLQHSSLVVIPAHRPCLPRRSVGEGGSLFPKAQLKLTHVLPPISTSRFSHLCRSRPRGSICSSLPLRLYLDHSHCPVLAPATLAALPSTRAIPDRDVFHVADPISSIETRSLPTLTRSYP